jgi:hypothetical protein
MQMRGYPLEDCDAIFSCPPFLMERQARTSLLYPGNFHRFQAIPTILQGAVKRK